MTTTYELYTNENGTPKAVEGKAPAILERVEALETSVESLEDTLDNDVVTSVNGNKGDITPEQTGCLPLGGGTMIGPVTSNNEMMFKSTKDTNRSLICGATDWSRGAHLVLTGKDQEGHGAFEVVAHNGDSQASLVGKVDGSLTWQGKNIDRSDGYAFWQNNTWCWLKKFEDGTLFIGSTWVNWYSGEVFTFPIPFVSTPTLLAHTNAGATQPAKFTWINNTGFEVYDFGFGTSDKASCWFAFGRWKE